MRRITDYIRNLWKHKKSRLDFVIGYPEALGYFIELADFLGDDVHKNVVGIGLSYESAYNAGRTDLAGKWVVDVVMAIRQFYSKDSAYRLPDKLHDANDDDLHLKASCIAVDSSVLEEVVHSLGYSHPSHEEWRTDLYIGKDLFFFKLAMWSHIDNYDEFVKHS